MSWFRVDDQLWGHPKALLAGDRALGLWTRAGSYSMAYLTDGLITRDALRNLRGSRTDAQRLVDAGLWDPDPEGWRFHDWLSWQPSRDSIETRRAANATRQARYRQRHD